GKSAKAFPTTHLPEALRREMLHPILEARLRLRTVRAIVVAQQGKPCHDLLYISGAFRRLYPVGTCNLTTEVAVLLTLYVALVATHSDSAWQILRRQLCRK